MILVTVIDMSEPPSSRMPMSNKYSCMDAAISALRDNYAPEGELENCSHEEVLESLREHYNLMVEVGDL